MSPYAGYKVAGLSKKERKIPERLATEGPRLADFNAFRKHEPRQMFWSGGTRNP